MFILKHYIICLLFLQEGKKKKIELLPLRHYTQTCFNLSPGHVFMETNRDEEVRKIINLEPPEADLTNTFLTEVFMMRLISPANMRRWLSVGLLLGNVVDGGSIINQLWASVSRLLGRYQPISHSVLWFSLWDVYRYQPISHFVLWFSLCDVYWIQPISHSVQWFSLCDVYWIQPISHSVQCFFAMRRISVSVHIALCAVILTMRRISVSAYITLCAVVFIMIRITVSAYITLCPVVFTMRCISISAHITPCAMVFTLRRISLSV